MLTFFKYFYQGSGVVFGNWLGRHCVNNVLNPLYSLVFGAPGFVLSCGFLIASELIGFWAACKGFRIGGGYFETRGVDHAQQLTQLKCQGFKFFEERVGKKLLDLGETPNLLPLCKRTKKDDKDAVSKLLTVSSIYPRNFKTLCH